eukprot:Em0016g938a
MASLLKSVFGASSSETQPTGEEMIEKLKNRAESSTLLEDRRDAVRAIKSLSRKFRREVGTKCTGILLDVLRNNRSDCEIVGYAVEALLNVVAGEEGKDNSLGAEMTDIFLKGADSIALLLNLLEDYDFQVRLPTTRLVTALLMNKISVIQEAVLLNPMGISRMMDLLQDSREVIRNEGLLLLAQLTRSNRQIQQIVAFENAFERLLTVIVDEGYTDGGIVVEDCFYIMQNLLKGNNSNQAFFREASLIQQLLPLFAFKHPLNVTWSPQKISNMRCAFMLVRTLVSPANPHQNIVACQKALNQCGLLKHLCDLMFSGGVPIEILIETINTVAEGIRGYEPNQTYFGTTKTPSNPPREAVLAILMSMVTEKQPVALRLAALYCFQSFVYKNDVVQAQIVNTLLPSSTESSVSAGHVLCAGLFGQDTLSNWCTAVALSNALNAGQKLQLLRVQLSMQGKGQVSLLQQCTNILAESPDLKVQSRVGLLVLLCTWLVECGPAVAQFLDNSANVSFLTAQISHHPTTEQDQLVRSLCAFLLGICLAYHGGDTQVEYSRATLLQVVNHRIGCDVFNESLGHLAVSEYFVLASKGPQPVTDAPYFDYSFSLLFKRVSDVIAKSLDPNAPVTVTPPPPAPQSVPEPAAQRGGAGPLTGTSVEDHDSIVAQYKELIRDMDQELGAARAKCTELEKARKDCEAALSQQSQEVSALREQLGVHAQSKQKAAAVGGEGESGAAVAQLQSTVVSLQRIQESQRQDIVGKDVLIGRLQQQLESARSLQEQLSSSASANVGRLKEEVANLKAENEALLTEKMSLDEQVRVLQLGSHEGHGRRDEDNRAVLDLRQELEALRQDYSKLEESKRTVEKEQEDLLVLLANHDSKAKEYRALLTAHSIPLPKELEEDESGSGEDSEEGEDS